MHEHIKEGIALAAEISKQLINLSTGILALHITFMKDALKSASKPQRRLLLSSWGAYLLTIIFALWHLSALTGSLLQSKSATSVDVESATLPAYLQMIAFLVGTVLIIVSAARSPKL